MFVHLPPAFRRFSLFVIMPPGWSCSIRLSGFSPLLLFVLHNSHRVPGLLHFLLLLFLRSKSSPRYYVCRLIVLCMLSISLYFRVVPNLSANIFTTSLTKFKFILNTLSASSRIIFKDSLVIIRLVTIDAIIEQLTLAITVSIFSPLYVWSPS